MEKKNKKNMIILSSLSAILLALLIPLSVVRGPKGDKGNEGNKGETGLKGEKGEIGEKGKDVISSFLSGDETPSSSLGNDGDYYLNNKTCEFYFKENGSWSFKSIFKGNKGEIGETGNEGNDGSNGNNGSDGNKFASTFIEKTLNGSVIPSKASAKVSEEIIYTIKPDEGYYLSSLYLNNSRISNNVTYNKETNIYTFKTKMNSKGNAISAYFSNKESTVGYFEKGQLKLSKVVDGFRNIIKEDTDADSTFSSYSFNSKTSGTSEEDAILISSVEEWALLTDAFFTLSYSSYSMKEGLYFKITNDLDFDTKYNVNNTSVYSNYGLVNFNGNLDGQNHKLYNFSYKNDSLDSLYTSTYKDSNTNTYSLISSIKKFSTVNIKNIDLTFKNNENDKECNYSLINYSDQGADITLDNITLNGQVANKVEYGGSFNYAICSNAALTIKNSVNNINFYSTSNYTGAFIGFYYNVVDSAKKPVLAKQTFINLTNNGKIINNNIYGHSSLLVSQANTGLSNLYNNGYFNVKNVKNNAEIIRTVADLTEVSDSDKNISLVNYNFNDNESPLSNYKINERKEYDSTLKGNLGDDFKIESGKEYVYQAVATINIEYTHAKYGKVTYLTCIYYPSYIDNINYSYMHFKAYDSSTDPDLTIKEDAANEEKVYTLFSSTSSTSRFNIYYKTGYHVYYFKLIEDKVESDATIYGLPMITIYQLDKSSKEIIDYRAVYVNNKLNEGSSSTTN